MTEQKILLTLCLAVLAQGCADRSTRLASEHVPAPFEQVLRDIVTFQIPKTENVWGVGIVGNLSGTGSSVCPPNIRTQLRRMMSSSHTEGIDLEAFIRSPNTAVVYVEGQIPGSAIKTEEFDIKIRAYDDSGGCSLAGGRLYRTDLALPQTQGNAMLQTVATAEGPVFVPVESGPALADHKGMVLGGGTVVAQTATHLILKEPGFKQASVVRNLINSRFGFGTAQAMSPAQVDVKVPLQYHTQKWRFWAVIEALPLADAHKVLDERLGALIQDLVEGQDLDQTEIALEAMGQACVPLLKPHLMSKDPAAQLAAGRCLSNLGFLPALSTLAQIATNPQSKYRVQAMHAIRFVTALPQVKPFVAKLLSDPDLSFAMDVYESLAMADGVGVQREIVAGAFSLDTVPQSPTQAILATRSGRACLALFGSPIQFKSGHIVEFPQKKMIFDARTDIQFVLISRSSGITDNAVAPVKCSRKLQDIIRVLCQKPGLGGSPGGFGLSYAEVLALIQQLSDQGIIPAKLWAGPLPQFS